MSLRRPARLAAVLLAATSVLGAVAPVAGAAARPQAIGFANRLFMVSDSVGLGAIPAMKSAFGASWQVTVTGKPGLFTEQLVRYVQEAPGAAIGESAIVATGYNYPYWDPARFDRAIDQMVNALKARGVQRIYWVTMREVKPAYYPKWNTLTGAYRTLYLAYPRANDQLRRALTRHPQLSIVDWAAVTDMLGLTYDAIHLNPTGAAKYAALARSTVVSGRTRLAAGTTTQVQVGGTRVPGDAEAVLVNLTAVNPRTAGYLSVRACDEPRPTLTNLWFRPNETVANAAVVPLGPGGAICIFQSAAAHLTVDLTGYVPAGEGLTAPTRRRALDTRAGASPAPGSTVVVHLGSLPGAPAGSFTAFMGITTFASNAGDLRVYTCGTTPPAVPARRLEAGRTQTVMQLVRTDASGDVCLRHSGTAHHTVDLLAALPSTAGLRPFVARRLADTGATPLSPGTARPVQVGGTFGGGVPATPTTTGAFLTVHVVPADSGGVTLYPCTASSPRTPFVQGVANHLQTNATLAAVDATGRVCLRSTVSTRASIDISGWSGTALRAVTQVRLVATLG